MRNQSTYQDRVDRIVAKDVVTTTNLAALQDNFDRNGAAESTVRYYNVHQWLIKAALRRNRKAQAEAHGPLNNALGLAFQRTKAVRYNGRPR